MSTWYGPSQDTIMRVSNKFFGMRDFPYLRLGIRDFKGKSGRDLGLKVCAGGGMPKVTLGITGLPEILGRDYGIKKPYWGPSIPYSYRTSTKTIPTGASIHTQERLILARFLSQGEAATRRSRKWGVTYRIGSVLHFGTLWTGIRIVAEVNKYEWGLGSAFTKVNIQEWRLGIFSANRSGTCSICLNDLFQFCAVTVHTIADSS